MFLIFSGIFLTLLIAALTGCGGGNNANPTTQTSPSTAGTTVQVGMGDSPADWIMAFGMTLNSITLSVAIDGSGNVSITPMFTAMMNPLGSGQNPWQGWMQHLVGSVASTSGSQFTTGANFLSYE